MAKKIRNITTSIQPKVTTLKLPSGKYTEIGKETCEEMMAKHFPTHTPKTNPDYNHTKIPTTDISHPEFKPWITQAHVRRVLLKFKAKKSPGPDKLKPIIFKHLPRNISYQLHIQSMLKAPLYTKTMERIQCSVHTQTGESIIPRSQIVPTDLTQQLLAKRLRKTASRANGSST